ncbi:MAG TPA: hypothetical protein VK936_13770 [Longimicrobiales bacterium]|nr:hypothetical protein [Longimicrobiales bacterium]
MKTLTLAMLAALQQQPVVPVQPPDPVYSTPAVEEIVSRAAALNAAVPAGLESYRARVETELSFVRAEPDGRETLLQLEQVASDLFWRQDGGVLQRLVGYRSQTLGASFSGLSFFDVPWIVPILYGERIDLVRTGGPVYAESGALLRRRALHPFAPNREDVYRFSGGDTVDVITLPARVIPIVRIRVEPRAQPSRPTLLFHGDVDLDLTRMHIVRMQGRLIPSGRGRSALSYIAQGVLFVSFETAEYDEGYWLPRTQRFEAQAVSRLGEERILFRAISRFVDIETNDPEAARLAADPLAHPYGLMEGADDLGALGRFGDWRIGLGDLNADVDARDFDAFGPPGFVRTGAPRLTFGARRFSQLIRINTTEGVFTGGGLILDAGDAAPGLTFRAHAGYAWAEEAVRGGVELAQRGTRWEVAGRAERQLAHTNDFTWAMDPEPGIPPLLAADQYDFVDRRLGGLVARSIGSGVAGWRLEVARARDGEVGRNIMSLDPIFDEDGNPLPPVTHMGDTRLNRPIFPGDYWLARAELRRHPSAGGLSLHPGLALRLAWEGTSGDLEWQRVEAGAALRRMVGRWTLGLRADAGAMFSSDPAPQALFELGTTTDLPGFDHKAFVGDRAVLTRGTVMFTLPLLNAPIRTGSLWLPAPAPSPSVGIQLGWTDASAETLALMDRFGWDVSDGVRAAIDLRLRFFGGSVSVGAARPLDRDGEWRFVWGLVGGL